MKTLFLSLILAGASFGQVSVNLGTVSVPNEVSIAVETWRLSQYNAQATPITLAGAINASVTTVNVSDATNISVGDQLVIGTEALTVSAKNTNALTVTRGATITTAAVHANGATVNVCKYQSIAVLFKRMIQGEVNAILSQQPSTSLAAQIAAKATADAAIAAFLAASVQ